MLERTAIAENGSALPGPSTTVPPIRTSAVRIIVPTLPGSEIASRKMHFLRGQQFRFGPDLVPDTDHPGTRGKGRHFIQQFRLDLLAGQTAFRGGPAARPARVPRRVPRWPDPPLPSRTSPTCGGAFFMPSFRISLSFSFSLLVIIGRLVLSVSKTKRAARLSRSRPVGSRCRQRTRLRRPPGRSRQIGGNPHGR